MQLTISPTCEQKLYAKAGYTRYIAISAPWITVDVGGDTEY